MKKTTLIVSGASGFSGAVISDYFLKKKYKVWKIYNKKKIDKKNQLTKKIDLTKKIKFDIKSDWLLHTASFHKVKEFKKNPTSNYKKNILMTKNILELAKKNEIKNFIFFSTIDISRNFTPKEKKFYIRSKIKSEKLLINAYKNDIIKRLYILRLPAVIGQQCNENFLKLVVIHMKDDRKIKIWNAHLKYNNFVHIDDICRLIKNILVKKIKKEKKIIECVSSNPIKLYDLLILMKKKLNSKSEIIINKKVNDKIALFKNSIGFKFLSTKKSILKFLQDN